MQVMENKLPILLQNETTIVKQYEVAFSQLPSAYKGGLLAQFIQQAARINWGSTTRRAIQDLLVHKQGLAQSSNRLLGLSDARPTGPNRPHWGPVLKSNLDHIVSYL